MFEGEIKNWKLPTHVLNADGVIPYTSNSLFYKSNEPLNQRTIKDSDHSYTHPTDPRAIIDVLGMKKDGLVLNSSQIRSNFEYRIEEARRTNTPINLITLVCPPYAYQSPTAKESYGLASSFTEDPLNYNFRFNYKVITFSLAYLAETIRNLGVSVNSELIIGDWAFRGINGIYESLPSDDAINARMDEFAASARDYVTQVYPNHNISIGRFRGTDIESRFPIGMPLDPLDKVEYMDHIMQNGLPELVTYENKVMMTAIGTFWQRYTEQLEEFTNPRCWGEIESRIPEIFEELNTAGISNEFSKPYIINFLMLLRNTLRSRKTKIDSDDVTTSPIKAGFYDALMKSYEYILYGLVFSERFPNAINYNWDTKFPASGHFYQRGGLDTLFLDPNRFPIPYPELGIKFNPF